METLIHSSDIKNQKTTVYTEYICKENKVVLMNYSNFKVTPFKHFDIADILECGQCFRFEKIAEKHYIIIAYGKVLNILQHTDMDMIEFYPCTKEEFENIWINYFDLDTNYAEIKEVLKEDPIVKNAIEFAEGIRILNQEPFECLISFIISQNNRITMIKQVIQNICEKYGAKQDEYYLFPKLEQLERVTQEDLRECKTGFRDKYIIDALNKIKNKEVVLEELIKEEVLDKDARNELIKIKGVGNKVADCTLLFSLKKAGVFPTDVWVKRVMEHYYFNGEDTSIKEIEKFAKNKWGELAGYAQQYLFYYARSQKIGVKEKKNKNKLDLVDKEQGNFESKEYKAGKLNLENQKQENKNKNKRKRKRKRKTKKNKKNIRRLKIRNKRNRNKRNTKI